MKRQIIVILSAIFLAFIFTACDSKADPASDFEFKEKNSEITIIKYIGDKSKIVIPTKINGMPVTSIGKGAFRGLTFLESVTIPHGFVKIEEYAFCDNDSLTDVAIPRSVIEIGSGAFAGCTSLVSINFPKSINAIGSGVFYDCTLLKNVILPPNPHARSAPQ